ncbi:DUF6792 domain-containing protein [Numidum massiliense]|uniref:DUF6792 domain-containing protein n=1 Tax=Numidum massiliense TaxID=1522315 RepID=UPI0028FCA66F|nr:DUF6792 domain-containing protein [Numidum massiliense]
MEKKQDLLNDLIRARLTSVEYDGITKDDVEKLYILEYGELPPKFEIIDSSNLGIGNLSGFHATAIHFYDKDVNEVYIFERGTEADPEQFSKSWKEWLSTLIKYKKNPEKLKEIVFPGNEDMHYDAYSVLMGEDQSQTEDAQDFIDRVIQKVNEKNAPSNADYYLDGHSLAGAEVQMILATMGGKIKNAHVYNDAPMNVYNIVVIHDGIKKRVKRKFNVDVNDPKELKKIPPEDLIPIIDEELGKYSDKITYYWNVQDLLTSLNLPFAYRLTNDKNVVMLDSNPEKGRPDDLVSKYPLTTRTLMGILHQADKGKGLSYAEMFIFLSIGLNAQYLPRFMQISLERELADLLKEMEELDFEGHMQDVLVGALAKNFGRTIIDNEEIITVKSPHGGRTIWLNIETAYTMYKDGQSLLSKKKDKLPDVEKAFQQYVLDDYDDHLHSVQSKMDEIEADPHAFLRMRFYRKGIGIRLTRSTISNISISALPRTFRRQSPTV